MKMVSNKSRKFLLLFGVILAIVILISLQGTANTPGQTLIIPTTQLQTCQEQVGDWVRNNHLLQAIVKLEQIR